MASNTNSKDTRVQPIFRWLAKNGGDDWAGRLLQLAEGHRNFKPGKLLAVHLKPERSVGPSAERLHWMLDNAERLQPRRIADWRRLPRRIFEAEGRHDALEQLAAGHTTIARDFKLETSTRADCLIECDDAVIWIEGKRDDWLDPSTKWDVSRDQLARNLDAAWREAQERDAQNYCVLLCHESGFKHHEELLIRGYRDGTWVGGFPHLTPEQRAQFTDRIATLRWTQIANEWPPMRTELPELHDLA